MANTALIGLSRSESARRLVSRIPVTRHVVERFVAGETDAEVVAVAAELGARGLLATVDRLGEDVSCRADADETATAYVALLERLAGSGLVPAADVSLKLSALGQALGADGDAVCLDNARRVCAAAAGVGATVSIDMEEHTLVERTLAAVEQLRADHPWVAVAVQAGLRRTEGDLAGLAGPGSRVRLVKGAYACPSSVAFSRKSEVDAAYERCLAILMAGRGHPQVATHDVRLLARAEALAAEHRRTPDSYEFQLLYGIRTDEQERLRAAGHQVRVYLPYGSDWYPYFVRRLAERPANLAFFARALARSGR